MENHGILNWRKWSPGVRKGALIGGAIGILLTIGGYALNRWAASFGSHGGDGGGFLLGIPSIVPLLPMFYVFQLFGGSLPREWDQGVPFLIYFLALLFNAIILAGLGAAIGYLAVHVSRFLRKK